MVSVPHCGKFPGERALVTTYPLEFVTDDAFQMSGLQGDA